ncbi:hypothetical protein [Aminobacter sp. LjRoot7]|uniref:hypothetical protein n=1 Tax=Aminobacter sp. LjRoot7 TaxID=3342335 RepID=UPI003ECFD1D9
MADTGVGRNHAAARDLAVEARGAEKLAAEKYGEPGHGMRITSPAAETEGRGMVGGRQTTACAA